MQQSFPAAPRMRCGFFVSMPEAHSVARRHGAFPPSGVLTMLKDKQDEAQRRAQRDALISMIFRTIVHDLNKSCDYAYILIGRIWGLGERQIQKILKHADESALGADDFAEFVVILQQILKKRRNE